ncbi:uncharacterized protein ATNIH1004_000650 [Aspergillus tanneri]|uniref:Uncharacterized protein n=1 Tax=Aspergillus tanneri TaxID=1220188 RepID=A0A5M9N2I3_9EURO|nr:uncharacterized protein ATNIH1004_000650 [Aspergillus tanneri]KAA8651754.1 hypothetical protein ATNIH1004_000650 [Aspergillus tanneri]
MLVCYYLALAWGYLCIVGALPISSHCDSFGPCISFSSDASSLVPSSREGMKHRVLGKVHIVEKGPPSSSPNHLQISHPRWKLPVRWPHRVYGYVVTQQPRHIQTATSKLFPEKQGHGPDRAQNRFHAVYRMIQSLRETDRMLAPVAILFVLLWLAIVAVGIVEAVNMCWERWGSTEGGVWGEERILFDVLEDAVIGAVPMEDRDDPDEEHRLKL